MPIYEFFSPETRKIYSFFARSIAYANEIPLCPDGSKFKMEKMFSAFSITGPGKEIDSEEVSSGESEAEDPFAGMSQDKANLVMQELENAMGGMDEDNPDPRQMGSLMRKMSELTGESMDEPMEEVVRKLEEGMNPDELEERMGDLDADETENSSDSENSNDSKLKRLFRKRKMFRDPKLYEFSDYLSQ